MAKPKKFKTQSSRSKRRSIERNLDKSPNEQTLSRKEMLYSLKYKIAPNQSELVINSLSDDRLNDLLGNPLPKRYEDIRAKTDLNSKNEFNREVLWYKNIILRYLPKINEFMELQRSFECSFIKADYSSCEDLLNQIEEQICLSQWSIEKRLLLAEYQYGFKRNKELLSQIVGINCHPLTNFFARYHSIKVERNQSYVKYEEIVEDFMKNINDPKINEFVIFKLNFYDNMSYNYKGFILSAESSASIIDMYIAFVNILTMACAERSLPADQQLTIKIALFSLYDKLNDGRIRLMLLSLGEEISYTNRNSDPTYYNVLEQYTIGNYLLSIQLSKEFLLENPDCFEIYVIYCKACVQCGKAVDNIFLKDSVGDKAFRNIYSVLLKDEDTQISLQDISKTYNVLGFSPWAYKAFTFFNFHNSIKHTEINITKLSHLNSYWWNPALSILFGSSERTDFYLNEIRIEGVNTNLTNFLCNLSNQSYEKEFVNLPTAVTEFRKAIYQTEVCESIGQYGLALDGYRNIRLDKKFINELNFHFNLEHLTHGMLLCYLNLDDLLGAMELVTESNLDNPNVAARLRYNFLINKIKDTEEADLISNISTPIFLHQYQKFIAQNDLWIAYDNFLSYHEIDYPSELEHIKDQFDNRKLVYFLKHICKPEVYDSSYLFENQEDLENERIDVCLFLAKIDEDNLEEYINEISEISRNQLIRKGIKQIDESKIYVDVAGIRKAMDKDLIESFNRLINLRSLPISQIDKLNTSNDDYLISYYDQDGPTDLNKLERSKIRITTYSTFEHFKDMVYKVRNMFIASNEYGIDTYLSMRIRHGTLLGEIRSVFENYHLITKKEDTSDKYQDNTFWLQKNIFNSYLIKSEFSKIFAEFSYNIDEISGDLKNNKLQISTEKRKSQGLFDYSFTEREILNLFKTLVDNMESHNVFFDAIIAFMWEKTETILSKIRDEISIPIKNTLLNLLTELSKNFETLIDKAERPELNELIRNVTLCQTDISNKLDKISEWFSRSNNKMINEFFLDLPIDAALVTLKRLDKEYSEFNPRIKNDCLIKFEGDTFPHFTYIMQNLLHNIVKHSKLSCSEIDVEVNISENNGELLVGIINNISQTINLKEINDKISLTQKLLEGRNYDDRTRAEGGTGYLKIKKTIVTDLLRENYAIKIYDVDESRFFKTDISFNINNLQKVYNNESIIN